ncbi:nuclear pore complex Nup153 isoform X1 [Pelobates cultripes]|uniref:Nuclear pore complex protein Nup153 n=2 Tax=Pelobates cultripes TaxID=61616 RepID=A0AAD1W5R4_PELCU|nr:nuclear pore complex Nup153 isoform X1 [Pelobates cultripes]
MSATGGGAGGGRGAGTGGKIRSRRYHLSAVRAPYSRSRQQGQQQGIISRVTDTVKSIVPGWLQKYFNKETAEPDGARDSSEIAVERTEVRENDEEADHHIYIDDDPPPIDGRITPDPVRLAEEPSTSRFSLSMPDVLTRPSLHRANLNFNVLDSPALHCQHSTSSAFPIGSSGYSLIKEIKDSTSQHDDDNISTTSGFSSRASDKDVAVSKNLNAPPLWSPEADRSNPLSHNSSMSAKKPTFNLSAFGSMSPSLGNASVLKSSQLGDSPFYPGKTTYGGAAAARSSRVRGTPYQAPVRLQVKAKPANSETYGVTSYAARRILQSLEKMSSPLADAKKIPSISSSCLADKSFQDDIGNSSKRKKVESTYPPVRALMTPKSIVISPNVSSYIKPSLAPSGLIKSKHRMQSDQQKESKGTRMLHAPTAPQTESFSFPKSSTPASNGLSSRGAGGKMMRERNSHYTIKPAEELSEAPVLPEVPLPLSTASLPSFNFSTASTATSLLTAPKPTDSKTASWQQMTNLTNNPLFTFSSPIVKSTESNAQSPGSSVGFTFSVPAVKSTPPTTADKMITTSSPAKSLMNNISAKKKEEEHGGFCKPAKSLKEGSVLDILKSPGFSSSTSAQTSSISIGKSTSPLTQPASKVTLGEGNKQAFGLWQCSSCFHENRASDNKCVACSAAKDQSVGLPKQPASSESSSNQKNSATLPVFQGFGDKFKVAAGTWDCDTCLVQNKPDVTKCVACDTPKPGTGVKAALLLPPVTTEKSTTSQFGLGQASTGFQFDDKFKKPVGSWECTVCCVQNKADDVKCIACTSDKPGTSPANKKSLVTEAPKLGLLDQFKKPSGSWDCDVCLVQNKGEATKCVACESAKPGRKSEQKGFASPSISSGSPAPSFKFGLQSSSNTDFTPSTNAPSVGFSFPKVTGDFKFGIASSAAKAADEKKDTGFSFGSTIATSNPVSGFQFGTSIPASTDKEGINKSVTSGFSFGTTSSIAASSTATESSVSSGIQSQLTKDKSCLPLTFGTKESDKKNETPAVSFSFGKVEQNKEAPSSFVFGRKDEKPDSTTTGQSLLFGKKSEGDEPNQFAFGKSEQTKDNNPTPPTFAFGVSKPVEVEKNDADKTAKPLFPFGSQPGTTTDAGASKQTFSFMSSGSTSGVQQSSAISSSLYGITAPSSTPVNPSGVFGSAAQTSAPAGSGSVFGSAAPSGASTNSGSVFGSSVAPGASSSSGNVFGSVVPTTTAASSTSVFGSAATLNASASSVMFSGAAPASTTSSSSVFGNTAPTSTSANSNSMFGNSGAVNNPTGSFVFGQPTSTAGGSVFGNTAESKPAFVFAGSESKPATATSTAASATPFVFGAGTTSTVSTTPGFNFGATNTSNALGTSSSPFIFGGPTPPAPSGLPASNPVPAFGANQSATPVFGTSSTTSLFPASSQSVPGFGSLTSSAQPPMFGQQATQPAFGSSTAPAAAAPSFQFGGNTNFNFASGSSPGGVFTFGSGSTGSSSQPSSSSGFAFNQAPTFNQAPAFNMGANGRSTPASTISNRKIKTARRRK